MTGGGVGDSGGTPGASIGVGGVGDRGGDCCLGGGGGGVL